MPCDKCTEGWIVTEQGAKRCACNQPPDFVPKPPVLARDQVRFFVEALAAMPMFPSDAGARTKIGDEFRSMCNSLVEADWLVTRMVRLYQRWPGLQEMRRVLASKHVPRDGVLPIGTSEHYPDGIPSEREERPLALAEQKRLRLMPPPEVCEAAKELPKMPAARKLGESRFTKTLGETVTAPQDRPELPGPTPQVITQADIDKAVAERRVKGPVPNIGSPEER